MAAFTAKASGNWSASGQTTWSEVGVPGDGDTVTIGAFTVTVDVNTTIGTSPNNTTTKVLDKTSSTGSLIVGAGVTLTVKGNLGGVNGATYQLNAGAQIVFDASASGGTPTYCIVNVGFCRLVCNGTSTSRCGISAVSGRVFSLSQNYSQFGVTYTNITRAAASAITANAANVSCTFCNFASCGLITFESSGTTFTSTITDNLFSSTTGSAGACRLTFSGAKTSGARSFLRNVVDKFITHNAVGFDIQFNSMLGGLNCVAGRTWSNFRNNFVCQDGQLNGGNGALLTGSVSRCYFVVDNASGNPHFIAPTALLGSDNIVDQCIFESQTPDLVDTGDCVLCNGANCSSTKVVIKNCLALPTGYSGSSVQTGQLLTVFSASTANNTSNQTQAFRNTVNQNQTAIVGVGKRAAFAFAEASSGFAGQVSALKSNIAWTATAGDGYLAERISGTVDGIITASGADYNWLHNIATDNNGRGYRDKANSPAQDLWSSGNADGGDAAAAGVDNNQGSGDPQFVAPTRNIAAWSNARGYGATYADGVTALQTSMTTRIPDLIAYVFEGYKPQNAACRTAGHDGACVGAANYESGRSRTRLDSITAIFAGIF